MKLSSAYKLLKTPQLKPELIKADDFVILRDRIDYNPFPPAYYYVDHFGKKAKKYFGGNFSTVLELSKGAYQNGRGRNVYGTTEEFKTWQINLLNLIVKNKGFVKKIHARSLMVKENFLKFCKQLSKFKPDEIEQNKLVGLHKQWMKFYGDFGFWNITLWFILGDKLAEYVMQFLKTKYQVPLTQQQILLTPTAPSYIFREEINLLKIARVVDFRHHKFTTQPPKIQTLLRHHAQQWEWLPFDYIGPTIWQEQDFLDRLFDLVKDKQQVKKYFTQREHHHTALKLQQKKILTKYKISKGDRRLIGDLHAIALMQDQKKEVCTLAQYILHIKIFGAFSKILGIKRLDCIKFHHEELWGALKNPNDKFIQKTLADRLKGICAIGTAKGISLIWGKKAVDVFDKFDPKILLSEGLSGASAAPGKAKGKVRILISAQETRKMNCGEILIAPMTTPDFVVAMKKAAAIVTDEGGLTSHAAIISRELGIPCIVGTKIATKVFKDGNMVEVDAEKGIVKKINH